MYWFIVSFFPPETVQVRHYTMNVVRGEQLEVVYDIKTYRNCSYDIYRELQGRTSLIPLNKSENFIPAGTTLDGFTVKIKIPEYVSSGMYNYVAKVTYICNPYDQIFPQKMQLENLPIIVR